MHVLLAAIIWWYPSPLFSSHVLYNKQSPMIDYAYISHVLQPGSTVVMEMQIPAAKYLMYSQPHFCAH